MRRRLTRAAAILAPIVLLAAILLPRLGAWLVVEDPLEKADAIIVLGGTMYERPLEALDLFNEGYAPVIYLLGEMPDWGERVLITRGISYRRIVDLQVDVLSELGVPRDAIRILDQANSTADEARNVRQLAIREKLSRVIVITSKQHTRRARLVMNRRLAGTTARVIMRASRYDRADVDRWWQNRSTLRFTLFETQRLIGYWTGIAD